MPSLTMIQKVIEDHFGEIFETEIAAQMLYKMVEVYKVVNALPIIELVEKWVDNNHLQAKRFNYLDKVLKPA